MAELKQLDGFYTTIDLYIVLSGIKYAVLGLPCLLAILYLIYRHYLGSVLPVLYSSNNAKSALWARLGDTIDGAEHIRGFGWVRQHLRKSLETLDRSQRLLYKSYVIQRQLLFLLELLALVVGLFIVATILNTSWLASHAAAGLSMVTLLTLGTNMAIMAPSILDLERGLRVIARIRQFINLAPLEFQPGALLLPPKWPRQGEIKLTNVYAKYK